MKLVKNIQSQLLTLGLLLLGGMIAALQAEGIQQVAPTAGDAPVMLLTNSPDFGNFASFNGPATSRLQVSIADPSETLFIGLAVEYDDDGNAFPGSFSGQYTFRIRDEDGNVVHGPFVVNNGNANVGNYAAAVFGAYSTTAQQGGQDMYRFEPPTDGDYSIEFSEAAFPDGTGNIVNIPFWDFTVVDANNVVQPGRLWSQNWAFRTPQVDGTQVPFCVWDRPFNGDLYSYTTDGFVSRIDFSNAGTFGLSFNITFNSKGPGTSGNLSEDRKSVPGANATSNSAEHQIFLVEPDPNLFPSGVCGEIITPLSFECLPQDSFCLEVSVTKPGQVEVILDFNQNGSLDANSRDVTLIYEFTENDLSACIPWDGLLGDNTRVAAGDTVNLIFIYTQGVQHWSAFDVEFMLNGYCVETVRPTCSNGISSNFLYWDDTNIPEAPGTGVPKDGRNGFACTDGIRTWNNFNLNAADCSNFDDNATSGYGDKSTLNTWWFANTSTTAAANIPVITATITGPDQICGGETATYTAGDVSATGQVTYTWSGPNNFTAATAEIMISAPGEYCVIIVDEENCQNEICKTLAVEDLSEGNVIYPTTVDACLGDVITLEPSTTPPSSYQYQWSPAGPLNNANSATPTLTVTGPQVFGVTVTDPVTGCESEQMVMVNQLIQPTASFSVVQGCEQGLAINFVNTSTSAATYQWDFGDPTTTSDTSVEVSPSYIYPGPGTYAVTLTATSADDCKMSMIQTVEVMSLPLVADFTVNFDGCSSDAVTVNFTNTSVNGANNTTSNSWTFSGVHGTSNEESPSIVVTMEETITAELTIMTADGCTASTSQTFAVQPGAPANQFPAIFTVCQDIARTITPAGSDAFTYIWSPSIGIDDINSPQPTFTLTNNQEYSVTVVANGDADCFAVETVMVNVAPDIELSVEGDGVYCTGQADLMAVVATGVNTTFEWFDADGMSVGTGQNFTPLITEPATYTVVATDEFGCTEASTEVTVRDEPVDVTITADGGAVVSCFGEEVVLNVTNLDPGDNLTYNWTPASAFVSGTNMLASPDLIEVVGTQTVSVVVTNQFGCTAESTIDVTVQPEINLEIELDADGDGDFCTDVATLTATTDAPATIEWFNANGVVVNVGETFMPTITGVDNYTVVARDAAGCTETSQTITVTSQPIDIEVTGNGTPIISCFEEEVILNVVNLDPSDNLTYLWEPASAFEPGTNTLANPDYIEVVGTQMVTVLVTNQFGCTQENTLEVTVQPELNLDIELDADGDGDFCTDVATLSATTDVPATIEWFDENGISVHLGNTFMPTITGVDTYTVVATDAAGCTEISETITVTSQPVDVEVTGASEPIVSCFGEEVMLSITNLDVNDNLTYLWEPASAFAPGTNTLANPDFLEIADTETTVTVTITNQFGCTQENTIEITIEPDINLDVTIGGDGSGNFCTETATLTATTNIAATIEWQDADGNILATGPTFNPPVSGVTEYVIVATAANGCSDATAPGEIVITGGPVDVSIPDTVAVCFGQELLLNVINEDPNDVLTYQWEPASAFVPGTETSASPNYIETIGPADVTVTIANQFGCELSEVVHLAVVDPNISLSFTDQIDCNGGTVDFTNTSQNAFGFVWDFGDGSAPSFEENPTHTYAAAGMYTVTLDIVYDVDCLQQPFSAEVEVETPQIFSDFTYNISDCSGDQAVVDFMDASTNTLNNTTGWSWTFENGMPATSTEQNPQGVVFAGEGPATVTLTIFTANDCDNTSSETLEIDLVDLDISLADSVVVCPGASILLNADGDTSLVYAWTPATGLDDPTAASPLAMPSETTTYSVVAYSTVGSDTCFVSDEILLFVPPAIGLEIDQDSLIITCGEDVELTAITSVDVEVKWTSAVDGELGMGTTITVNPFRNDTITASATDQFGCSEMDTVIIIDEGVDISIDPGEDGSLSICAGVETVVTITNEDVLDTLSYAWIPEDIINGPTNGPSVEIEIFEPGITTLTALITNQNNCLDTVMIEVEVIEFEAELPDSIFVCSNEPTPLNPGGNTTYTYNWEPTMGLDLSDPANPIATLTENQTYMVTTTDPATGCIDMQTLQVIVYPDLELETSGGRNVCDDSPVTLTASTAVPANIVWFFDGEVVGTGDSIQVVVPQVVGCYDYVAVATDTLTNCEQMSTEQVCFKDLGDFLPDIDLTVCPGEPTPINPGGDPNLTYEWSPVDETIDLTNPHNPVVTTTEMQMYGVTVTDNEFGCTAEAIVTVSVFEPVGIMVSPVDTSICSSTGLVLMATTEIPATITWFSLPDNEELGTGDTLQYAAPAGASQVYAVGVSEDGCTEISETITINAFPVDATIDEPFVICEPSNSETLTVTNNTGDQELTYSWEPLGVLTALDEATVTVDPTITTDYMVTVTNQFGCEEVLTTSITIVDLAGDLTITADPDTVLIGDPSILTVEGCIGCEYDWDPPAENDAVIEVFPELVGENDYFVTVSLLGCEEDLMVTVFGIDSRCDGDRVFLPNAFTPNNDGENDELRIRCNFLEEISEMEWLIYNRWGEEMFRTTDPFASWDGTYRGEALAPDTYGYYLRAICPGGDELIQKGNVTILR